MQISEYYDEPPIASTPEGDRVDRHRAIFLGLAGLSWAGIWIWELVHTWSKHGFFSFLIYAVIITLVYLVIALCAGGVFAMGRAGVLGLAAFFGVAVWITNVPTALLISIPALFAAIAGAVQPRSSTTYYPVEQKLLDQRVIGDPGAGLAEAIGKFGVENVTKGIAGEQITSDAFAAATDRYPVVQLINGLKFPGTEKADVDHALVYGDKVALLDSKYWAGDDFRWAGPSLITSGRGETLRAHEIAFPVAVERLRSELTGKDVQAWVLIHSGTGLNQVTVEQSPEGFPALVPGAQWLEQVMAWLQEGQEVPSGDEALGRHCHTVKTVLDFKQ